MVFLSPGILSGPWDGNSNVPRQGREESRPGPPNCTAMTEPAIVSCEPDGALAAQKSDSCHSQDMRAETLNYCSELDLMTASCTRGERK